VRAGVKDSTPLAANPITGQHS